MSADREGLLWVQDTFDMGRWCCEPGKTQRTLVTNRQLAEVVELGLRREIADLTNKHEIQCIASQITRTRAQCKSEREWVRRWFLPRAGWDERELHLRWIPTIWGYADSYTDLSTKLTSRVACSGLQ